MSETEMSENAESQMTIYPTIAAMLRDGICGGYYTCNGRLSNRYAYARINRAIARGAIKGVVGGYIVEAGGVE